uniref:UDP-N-acetylglucosamine 4-epimerase n=2 Tax=Lygus hesperus TaxID=30085 RepID=A0A0A9X155_LYGHE
MSSDEYKMSIKEPRGITILVTGAGGYIGSHACLALLEAGFNVIALDNMVNCWKDDRLPQPESLIRVQILAGRQLKFYHGELLCKPSLEKIFVDIIQEHKKIDVCMHFAALKAVGESCAKPLEYYKNNITGTMNLIELLEKFGCKSLVYSSSATVYGDPSNLPISENELTGVGLTNPYGKTKYMTEEILKDLCNAIQMKMILEDPKGFYLPVQAEQEAIDLLRNVMQDMLQPNERSKNLERLKNENTFLRHILRWFVDTREKLPIREDFLRGANCTSPEGKTKFICEEILKDLTTAKKDWGVISLRYFNPVGAHVSGLIGEDPNGIPNNLVPFVAQVAAGKLPKLKVFGGDYPTKDGTGVRDYIHITDLITGHIKALEFILKDFKGFKAYNLGTGKGYSVLDVIRAFREASGKDIPYEIVDRRPGDIAASYCDASLAEKDLGWIATRDIHDMCQDVWRWQSRNINGFKKETDPNCILHSPKNWNCCYLV